MRKVIEKIIGSPPYVISKTVVCKNPLPTTHKPLVSQLVANVNYNNEIATENENTIKDNKYNQDMMWYQFKKQLFFVVVGLVVTIVAGSVLAISNVKIKSASVKVMIEGHEKQFHNIKPKIPMYVPHYP